VAHPLLFVRFEIGCKRKESLMKNYMLLAVLLALTQSSCAFLGGAATGAVAAGAGYEIQAKRQMDRLDEDFKNRRISREEYQDRKKQIEKGSIIY
jgi:membrane-bound lytic murein transglycosylase B